MVTEWGMSEKIGPLNFSSGGGGEVFLGRDFSRKEAYSEATSQAIDAEIRRIVVEQYERALKLLTDNRDALERVALALLEHETISGDEVNELFDGRELVRPPLEAAVGDDDQVNDSKVKKKKRPSIFPPIGPVGKGDPDPEPA